MAVPLASAFVRLRPDTQEAEFRKAGQKAGAAAGDEVGKGVTGGVKRGLAGSEKDTTAAGGKAGSGFADGFYRDASGKLRQANGRFATDAQKKMIEGGGAAGRGFGNNFTKEGGGIISRGFGKLKGELGPLLVPLGIGAAVAAIGKIGIEYEDNLNIFRSVTKATGDQMAIVADQARKLGADVNLPGVSAAGAAAAMTELAKAGFSVEEAMDAARGTLQLARVANISEADAAEIASNAVNAFGIQAKDTTFVVDELAAAANSSSIEITEAKDSFKQAAAVFSGFQGRVVGPKEAITELNTAIAILGNNGIKGSDAGTSLKQMLLQLTGPSQQAKGIMQELAIAAGGANVPLEQQTAILHGGTRERETAINSLVKMNPKLAAAGDIAYDASGKMRPLRDIIDLVAKGTASLSQEERDYAITQVFGADASRAVFALLKGGLPLYDEQRKAVIQTGAAADFAAAKNAGLGGAIDNLKGQFENMAIAIYNAVKGPLTTAVNGLAGILAPIAGYIATFTRFVQENISTIRDWAVAIGAVTLAIQFNSALLAINAAGGLVSYIKGIRIITTTTRLWAGAQALLNASLLANPIGLVVIAITALVAGLVLAYRHSDGFRKIVDTVGRALRTAFFATINYLTKTVFPALVVAFQTVSKWAIYVYQEAILPAWHAIQVVIGVVVAAVKGYIALLISVFNGVVSVVRFLYNNVFAPIFSAIRKVVEIWWLAVRVVFAALVNFFQNVIFPVVRFLYNNIFAPIFGAIRKVVEIWWLAVRVVFQAFVNVGVAALRSAINGLRAFYSAIFNAIAKAISVWWGNVKFVFGLFTTYVVGPLRTALTATKNFFVGIFNAVAGRVKAFWNSDVKPQFELVKLGWQAVQKSLSDVYNNKIKPVFNAFVGFIKDKVVGGFKTGVEAIRVAWEKVQEYARKPVAFVVNHVINPFIGGLNAAAKIVGVKDKVEPIKGFYDGGQVTRSVGYYSGGRIAGTAGLTDNRQAMVSGLGPVQLNGGEFIVNAKDTRKALPLLEWVNRGMSGGATKAARYLGRPPAREPGDGSEGWAFKDGGLIGWVKDVWGAVTDPVGAIKKPFENALSAIPGVGMIKDFLVGGAKKLLGGAIGWLTGFGGGGGAVPYTGSATGRVGEAARFVSSQAGKPYIWSSAGPSGYDCSGIVSAAYNILKGRTPYSHTFSTGGLPGGFFTPGVLNSPLIAGWSHPGQRPASASVGHMAGQIAGLPFESRGSRGVVVGNEARKVREFANIGGARLHGGGIVTPKLFDNGGAWESGTFGFNGSGRTEYVDPNRGGHSMADVVDRLEQVVDAIVDVAPALGRELKSSSRSTVQASRTRGRGVTP